MKIRLTSLIGAIAVISNLTACGVDQEQVSSSTVQSSTPEQTSSSSLSTVDSSVNIQIVGTYTAIPAGTDDGLINYQAIAIDFPDFDRQESLAAFEQTLYPHLRSSGCVGCHSNEGAAQAPLHSDGDVALAHEYAITKINFRHPENSRFVERMKLDRHNCPGSSCASAATKMLEVVNDYVNRVKHMIPDVPRVVAENVKIDVSEVKQWIATDKGTLPAADLKYYVYTSMHELHNEGVSAQNLNTVRVALSKALNSTARWAPALAEPTDVNGKGILYRIDIRDYWGYNQGVKELYFGGSDDDLAFGNGKKDYKGNTISASVQAKKYNFTNKTVKDPEHALRIWERVLHGNVEGAVTSGTIPPYIDGFKGTRKTNAAGEYVDINGFEWVETAQLVYTITRPDVYNAIMTNPFYADEMERNLEVDISDGMDSYDYILSFDAITIDSRLLWRAKRKEGNGTAGGNFYWKSWDVFAGQLSGGNRDRNIFEVYAEGGDDIRYPFWANPIPKFVNPAADRADNSTYSFVATLAQSASFGGSGQAFTSKNAPGCDNQSSFAGGTFGNCKHYSGSGGGQQSASEIIYDLPNGMQGYYLTGGFNQRRVDAFNLIVRDPRILTGASDDIAYITGYGYTNGGGSRVSDPRLNTGSSCIGCHSYGMNRMNNDLRDWLDNAPDRLPKGKYGVDGWINNSATTQRVRELYKPNDEWKKTIESDREIFLRHMSKIQTAMVMGPDKNVYVEPVIWTVEYVQRVKYKYRQTTSN